MACLVPLVWLALSARRVTLAQVDREDRRVQRALQVLLVVKVFAVRTDARATPATGVQMDKTEIVERREIRELRDK